MSEQPPAQGRRHAVVTGAAGDIGRAMVAALLRDGFAVTAVDRRDESDAAELLESAGSGPLEYRRADVRDRDEIAALLAAVPPVDVAVGNAGVGTSSPFLETSDELWDDTLAVNLTANFRFGQLVARQMVERRRGGRIVFTGSWVGAVPWPDITPYAVSKAGLVMLAKQMARELAPHRVLVNVVAPGIVDAGLAKVLRRTDPVYARRATKVIPLGDFQTAEQVAGVTAFLCSPAADYVTGTVLLADGGCSLFRFDES
jgi:NAD(P)-dependent dehydrogenase (short-subunit alcohol dehydrogenase family)